jgi:hypothetical protein
MMPSAAELLGLVIMFLLIAAGVALLLRNGAEPDSQFWGAASDTLLPLFGLGLLLFPTCHSWPTGYRCCVFWPAPVESWCGSSSLADALDLPAAVEPPDGAADAVTG